jgi:three-Cys-motif partner protein
LFIEKSTSRYQELAAIKAKYPNKEIEIKQADANSFLQSWCRNTDWKANRAVVFLDPFGTSVDWQTIEQIAETQAIDLWILFPLFAVNRMLVRGRKPPEGWSKRLTQLFGTDRWETEFYADPEPSLFVGIGGHPENFQEKTANYQKIGKFFVDQLKKTFVAAADPLLLRNSRNSPLYLLCFAAGNKAGAGAGMNIAKSIIERK